MKVETLIVYGALVSAAIFVVLVLIATLKAGSDEDDTYKNKDRKALIRMIINNHDRTNVYGYNCNGHSQQHRADGRKDLVHDS